MYWNVQRPYNQDKAAIGSAYFNAVKSAVISASTLSLNEYGVKAVEANLFVAKVNGVERFLPRDVAQGAVTTGETDIEVTMPELFVVGDVLYHLEPTALITLTGAWVPGDTLNIEFSEPSLGLGVSYVHTQVGADLAALDDELATALNTNSALKDYARFEVTGAGEITVYSKGLSPAISVTATTAGSGDAAVTNQFDASPVMIGTIASIDYANKTVRLAANSAIAIPESARIGTLTEDIYGLYNHSIDFTDKPQCYVKAIDRADRVYILALPYYDQQLKALFPRMNFV